MKIASNCISSETWNELEKIFDVSPFKFNGKVQKSLERLGYRVYRDTKHPKMYIELNGKTYVITLSTTPSDCYAGRQMLRQIRKVYENVE